MVKRFRDIPKFPNPQYRVDTPWTQVERWIERQEEVGGVHMNPDFQRGHVWTREQKIAYLEYQLKGGRSGKEIYFNHPGWMGNWEGEMVCLDGLQRITAVREFMRGEVPAFGLRVDEFEDRLTFDPSLSFAVFTFKTRAEVLRWYLAFNSGGTVHSQQELDKVKSLLMHEMERSTKT